MSHGRRSSRPTLQAASPFVIAFVAFTAWRASMPALAVATLVLGVAHQLVLVFRGRRGRLLGVHAAGAALLAGLLVLSLAGPGAVLLMLPAGFAYLFVGLGLAQNAAVRERAARALRRRRLPVDEAETAAARDRAALALVPATCALALLLVPIATWTFASGSAAPSPPPVLPPRGGSAPAARGAGGAGDASGRGRPVEMRVVDSMPDPRLPRQVVLEATPTVRGVSTGDLGPIYLRGLPFVYVDGRRREDVSRLRTIQDPDDGQPDGWCELAPRARAADSMVLAVHGVVPEIAPTGEVVVFCPPATSAVELPDVRADAGGAVVARREPGVSTIDYRLLARLPSRVAYPRTTTRILGGDPRAAARSAPVPGTLEVAAHRAAADVSSGVESVRAVVRYLRENFKYEQIDGRFDPADGLVKFAAERHGTCLQFAEAGVVMLRSLGIAARVGRGFLLTSWDDERRLYVAHSGDAHAWVEVEFEGCGFVIFDPTPRGGAGGGGAGVDDPSRRDAPETPPDAPAPDVPPTPPDALVRLDEVIDDVRGALGRAWDWIAANPWPCVAAVVVASLFGARTFDRRTRRLAGERVDAPAPRGPWERLVADLARRGHRRRPSQTETEFAAAVVASGGDALRPLLGLVERRQATRFGGVAPSPQEQRDIEAFRAAL